MARKHNPGAQAFRVFLFCLRFAFLCVAFFFSLRFCFKFIFINVSFTLLVFSFPPLFFFKFWLRQKLKPSLVFIFICVLLFCLRLSLLGHRTGGLVRAKREQPGTMGN